MVGIAKLVLSIPATPVPLIMIIQCYDCLLYVFIYFLYTLSMNLKYVFPYLFLLLTVKMIYILTLGAV